MRGNLMQPCFEQWLLAIQAHDFGTTQRCVQDVIVTTFLTFAPVANTLRFLMLRILLLLLLLLMLLLLILILLLLLMGPQPHVPQVEVFFLVYFMS
jgi:hypothetical protein